MEASVKIIKNLSGEFVKATQVKEATQKEYNQREWNNTVGRYSKYGEVTFFKTPGTIYEYDYYAIYIADGIRFLANISYSSSLTNGGFAYGFFTKGMEDREAALELVSKHPELKGIEEDSLTILVHSDGRIGTHGKARNYMREQTRDLQNRFFTKEF
jgi:hypothetical protein